MKRASAMQKGARLQKWTCDQISEVTGIETGKDCLIDSRESGHNGVDVKLIGEAQQKYPFSVECKNQQTWSLPAYIKQAKANQKEGTNWQLVLSRNHYQPVIVMDATVWFQIWHELLTLKATINEEKEHISNS